MLKINLNHPLIKIYEFLSGNRHSYDKPESLCHLFWQCILILITSPLLLIIGILGSLKGTLAEDIRNANLKKRYKGSFYYTFFWMLLALHGAYLNEHVLHLEIWNNKWFAITGGAIISGVFFFLFFIIVIGIVGGAIELFKIIGKKSVKLFSGNLNREEKSGFITGKLCPRIKWEKESED